MADLKILSLLVVTFFSGIASPHLSPLSGITIFFSLSLFCFFVFFRETKIHLDSITYLIFAFYSLFSAFWANDKWGSVLFSQTLISGSLFYTSVRLGGNRLKYVLYALLFSGFINGLVGFFQGFSGEPRGLFYNRNPYAGFLLPILFLNICLLFEERRKVLYLLLPFFFFSILLSSSRGAIYSCFFALFVVFIYLFAKGLKKELKYLIFLLLIGLFSYLFYLFFAKTGSFVKTASMEVIEKKLTTNRWEMFKVYPELFFGSFFFGYGMNSFALIVDKVFSPILNIYEHGHVHAHNLFFNILLELGIIGFLLFLFFLYFLFFRSSAPFLSKMCVVSFLLPNLFEYNFPCPVFQVTFLSLSAKCYEGSTNTIPSFFFPLKKAFIFLLFLIFLLFSVLPFSGNLLTRRAFESLKDGKIDYGLKLIIYSRHLCWFCAEPNLMLARILNSVYSSQNTKDEILPLIEKSYLEALRWKKSAENYIEVAKFFYNSKRKEKALYYLLQGFATYPFSLQLKTEMGKFFYAAEMYEKSLRFLFEVEETYAKYDPKNERRTEVLSTVASIYEKKGWMKASSHIRQLLYEIKSR